MHQMKRCYFKAAGLALVICTSAVLPVLAHEPHMVVDHGDTPALPGHVSQAEIDSGKMSFEQIMKAGGRLFSTVFNRLDGQGRPGTTGGESPRPRGSAPDFIRTSAPDSNSCAGCHNQPRVGGAGDFVANVFVMAQVLNPVTDSVSAEFSNERNTLGMFGSSAIEMLAREMTADLFAIRDRTMDQAKRSRSNVTLNLVTKGVSFGTITGHPDGSLDTRQVEGVDTDLIIKPFHQRGVVNSLRVFTVNAMNHHHGIQAVERFGVERTGTRDFDQDGVPDELSIGDITAVTIWQAALSVPGRVMARSKTEMIDQGELRFDQIGCAGCHRPVMVLKNPIFTEPNPYNPPGNLQPKDLPHPFAFDLTKEGFAPRLEKGPNGTAIVRAYTDLKRHKICDSEFPHFCNERKIQGGVPLDQFLTRKLWDVGNSAPYGHRGDLTTIGQAIMAHGGEARAARDAFAALPPTQQAEIVEFLKCLQVVPEGAMRVTVVE